MAEPGSNPRYNNAKVLLAKVSALRAGDLLLTRNLEGSDPIGRFMSAAILRTTGGSFDHVLMCTVPPTLIEAVTAGVGNLTLARCFAHSSVGVRVLRYHDAAIAAAAASKALTYIGRPYAKAGAAASIFPAGVFGEIAGNNIFCSALVAQVFQLAGAAEFLATPVEKTTPATIERMAGLTEITSEIFWSRKAPMNIEEMSALDGDRVMSPVDVQVQIFAEYMRVLAPLAGAIVVTFPEARLTAPQSFINCLQFIVSAMDAGGRVSAEAQGAFAAQVSALDDAAFSLLDAGAWERVMDDIDARDDRTMMRDLEESMKSKPDIDMEALRALKAVTPAQLKSRAGGVEFIRRWGIGRSKAMDRYLPIAERSLVNLRNRAAVLDEIDRRLGAG